MTDLYKQRAVKKVGQAAPEPGEEHYRSLFVENPDGVYSLDPRGKFVAVNPAMEGLTGYASQELIGKNSARLIAPENRRRAAECFSEALRGEPRNYEMSAIR